MKGEIDTYRLRLGGLRVVYEKNDTVMTILVLKI
jgi:mRNA-degrading endonuclease RelE of RelBE toxin-antitoxin system